MRIALCLVVKDEVERVAGAIEPFIGHVDEIHAVDNGSTDGTVALLEKMGVVVTVVPEPVGMAKLRNAVDKAASGCEWHLHVDADERWDRGFIKRMRDYQEIGAAFSFPRVNLPDSKGWPDPQVRYFKMLPGVRWEKPMYNELVGVTDVTMLQHPMLHLPRRDDVKRPWW